MNGQRSTSNGSDGGNSNNNGRQRLLLEVGCGLLLTATAAATAAYVAYKKGEQRGRKQQQEDESEEQPANQGAGNNVPRNTASLPPSTSAVERPPPIQPPLPRTLTTPTTTLNVADDAVNIWQSPSHLSPSPSPSPTASPPPSSSGGVLALLLADFPPWRCLQPKLNGTDTDTAPTSHASAARKGDTATSRSNDGMAANDFDVRPLTGGSSNTLWLVRIKESGQKRAEELAKRHAASNDSKSNIPFPLAIVVRFYGVGASSVVSRVSEAAVAELLSSVGVGARIYHHLSAPHAGRIEEFIKGRTVKARELSTEKFSGSIAREMARLHSVLVPSSFPLPRQPVLFRNLLKWFGQAVLARGFRLQQHASSRPGSLDSAGVDIYSRRYQDALYASLGFPVLDESWTAERMAELDWSRPEQLPAVIRENKWYKEIRWLQRLLANWHDTTPPNPNDAAHAHFIKECAKYSNLTLCHNDLNPGNILYADPDENNAASSPSTPPSSSSPVPNSSLTMIDFEYAGFNPVSYDLANTFCEMALDYAPPEDSNGHACAVHLPPFFRSTHQTYFPDQDRCVQWCMHYLMERKRIERSREVATDVPLASPPPSLSPSPSLSTSSASPSTSSSASSFSSSTPPACVSHLYASSLTYMMASHLLWSLWSVIQSASQQHSDDAHPSWENRPTPPCDDRHEAVNQTSSTDVLSTPFSHTPHGLLDEGGSTPSVNNSVNSPSPVDCDSSQTVPQPFVPPPLCFLEYAETRLELYSSIKHLWCKHNSIPSEEFDAPTPPRWQMMRDEEDWRMWREQLTWIHEEMRHVKLKSVARQQKALRRYQETVRKYDEQQRGRRN